MLKLIEHYQTKGDCESLEASRSHYVKIALPSCAFFDEWVNETIKLNKKCHQILIRAFMDTGNVKYLILLLEDSVGREALGRLFDYGCDNLHKFNSNENENKLKKQNFNRSLKPVAVPCMSDQCIIIQECAPELTWFQILSNFEGDFSQQIELWSYYFKNLTEFPCNCVIKKISDSWPDHNLHLRNRLIARFPDALQKLPTEANLNSEIHSKNNSCEFYQFSLIEAEVDRLVGADHFRVIPLIHEQLKTSLSVQHSIFLLRKCALKDPKIWPAYLGLLFYSRKNWGLGSFYQTRNFIINEADCAVRSNRACLKSRTIFLWLKEKDLVDSDEVWRTLLAQFQNLMASFIPSSVGDLAQFYVACSASLRRKYFPNTLVSSLDFSKRLSMVRAEYQKLISAYTKSTQGLPFDSRHRLLRYWANFEMNLPLASVNFISDSKTTVNPEESDFFNLKSLLYLQEEGFKSGRRLFETSIKNSPSDPRLWIEYAWLEYSNSTRMCNNYEPVNSIIEETFSKALENLTIVEDKLKILSEWERISALSEPSVEVCINVYAQYIWLTGLRDSTTDVDSSKSHLKRSSTSTLNKVAKQSLIFKEKNTAIRRDSPSILSSWDPECVVFLNNVAFGTREEHVMEAFKTCQISNNLELQPEHIILVRDENCNIRGFGHALFSKKEKAKLAIQKLDRKIRISGRPLFLSVYQPVPRNERVSSAPVYPKGRDGYTLFLSKIHPSVRRESEIAHALGVRLIDLHKFNTEAGVMPSTINQKDDQINIEETSKNIDFDINEESRQVEHDNTEMMMCENGGTKKPSAQVRLVFSPDGHFKGVAYVQFERKEDALEIFERFKDGGPELRGNMIRVQISDPQGARNRSLAARMTPRAVATRKTKISIDLEHDKE